MRVVLLLSILVVLMPGAAGAQDDDMAYCAQLATIYRRYIQNSPGRQYDAEAAVAQDDCQKGNTQAAIPILEQKLLQEGFTLPKRSTR